MNRTPAIWIDLGACKSCVAVFHNGQVNVIESEFGERTTPSIVSFTETERLVGKEAKDKINRNSKNTIFDAKRLFGRKFSKKEIQENIKYWPFEVINEPK